MLIRDTIWDKIRSQFSEEEKAQLRTVFQAHCICPKGVIIDDDRLDPPLQAKIRLAVSDNQDRRIRR
jgi:hypothetical protein